MHLTLKREDGRKFQLPLSMTTKLENQVTQELSGKLVISCWSIFVKSHFSALLIVWFDFP